MRAARQRPRIAVMKTPGKPGVFYITVPPQEYLP